MQFLVDGTDVRVVSAEDLLRAVWANNNGAAGDAVADVRSERAADAAAVKIKWDRVGKQVQSAEDKEISQALLSELGLW